MKGISLGPLGPASYRGAWYENGLKQIERWINTLVQFRGATHDRDGADGLVPQPKAGDENKFLCGDGTYRDPTEGASGTSGSIQISDGSGGFTSDPGFTYNSATDTLSVGDIDADVVSVVDEAYGAAWDGKTDVPTKNALYDKIETLAASVSPVPVFTTTFAVAPVAGRQEYVVAAAAVVVTAATKAFWGMFKIESGGTVKKKIRRNYAWDFTVQLRSGAPGSYSYVELATASIIIKSNGLVQYFKIPLYGFHAKDGVMPAGTYDLMLVSNFTGPITPEALQISVMGQVP